MPLSGHDDVAQFEIEQEISKHVTHAPKGIGLA